MPIPSKSLIHLCDRKVILLLITKYNLQYYKGITMNLDTQNNSYYVGGGGGVNYSQEKNKGKRKHSYHSTIWCA